MFKRIIAIALTILMLSALALPALAKTEYPEPLGPGAQRAVKATVPHSVKTPGMSVKDYYSTHDYLAVYYFLEAEDNGVKNGARINPDYDGEDPETWYSVEYDEEEGQYYVSKGFTLWAEEDGYWYLDWANIDGLGFDNILNLSDCGHLEYLTCENNYLGDIRVSGCSALKELWCSHNWIESINLSGCGSLYFLDCSYCSIQGAFSVRNNNALVYLDVSNNLIYSVTAENDPSLRYLFCEYNWLESLSVSNCDALLQIEAGYEQNYYDEPVSVSISGTPSLVYLALNNDLLSDVNLTGLSSLEYLNLNNNELTEIDLSPFTGLKAIGLLDNPLTEIDLSNCPLIPRDLIMSEGNGTVGYLYSPEYNENGDLEDVLEVAVAYPGEGAQFTGWFGEDGTPLYFDPEFDLSECGETQLTARFGKPGSIPGDADGNGTVDTTDALLVLRAALNIDGDPAALLSNCDMDGNGIIDTTDALMILRLALGIE